MKGPSRSCHGEGNRQQLGPERLLDLSGVAGGDKLDAAGKQTVLYSFTCGADGYGPAEGVIRDAAGTFYGTTTGGGTGNSGVVFKVDLSGHETVLYNFTGGTDGDQPYAGVIRDSAGNLYGTTAVGGASGFGAVHKLDKSGHQTVLYSFTGDSDGCSPQAGLIRDTDGNLYGTNPNCGSAYAGTVYKVDARGGETHSPMVLGPTGEVSSAIRQATCTGPFRRVARWAEVVYMVDPNGNEVVYGFIGGLEGGNAQSGLIRDSKGNHMEPPLVEERRPAG